MHVERPKFHSAIQPFCCMLLYITEQSFLPADMSVLHFPWFALRISGAALTHQALSSPFSPRGAGCPGETCTHAVIFSQDESSCDSKSWMSISLQLRMVILVCREPLQARTASQAGSTRHAAAFFASLVMQTSIPNGPFSFCWHLAPYAMLAF